MKLKNMTRLNTHARAVKSAVLLLVAVVSLRQATAFDPDEVNYGHSFITRSVASTGYNQWGDTVEAFTERLRLGEREELGFSADAVDQLVIGTRAPDFLQQMLADFYADEIDGGLEIRGEPLTASAHCDDERIGQCSKRIFDFTAKTEPVSGSAGMSHRERMHKESAVNMLYEGARLLLRTEPTAEEQKTALGYGIAARVKVGRALHTTQDFYAHSNWSNMFLFAGDFLIALGQKPTSVTTDVRGEEGDLTLLNRTYPESVATCQARLIPDSTKEALKQGVINALGSGIVSGLLTDSVWVGLIDSVMGLKSVKDTVLNFDNSGGNYVFVGAAAVGGAASSVSITSGYFDVKYTTVAGIHSAADGANGTAGAAKCDHGLAKIGNKVSGINKDTPFAPFTPAPQGTDGSTPSSVLWRTVANPTREHKQASFHAAKATRQIFTNVINAINEKAGTDDVLRDKMVELFMGLKPVTAVVVDVTGSMQDIIDGVANDLEAIEAREAEAELNTPPTPQSVLNRARKYTLTTYTETNNVAMVEAHPIGSRTLLSRHVDELAGTAQQVAAKLRTIQAFGGGDCPEPTLTALAEAVRRSPRKSRIFLYTDAAMKADPAKYNQILEQVKKKKLEVTFSLSGSCSPIDPRFAAIAAASGGQVLLVDHTSADTSIALSAAVPGTTPLSTIHLEQGTLPSGTSKTINFPVEAAAKTLLISTTNDSAAIVVRDPAGVSQTSTPFIGGAMVKVANPTSGTWSVQVSADGVAASNYSVKAQILGAFDILDVAYDAPETMGETGHKLSSPYGETPPATNVRMSARMRTDGSDNPKTYVWQAVAADGSVIGSLDLSRKTLEGYEGLVPLNDISAQASRNWRVRVTGTDRTGASFARMLPAQQSAAGLVADLIQIPKVWVPGLTHSVKFRVRNFGVADGYAINATTSLGQIGTVSPGKELAGNEEAEFEVKVQLPAATSTNASGVLNLQLTSRLAGNGVVKTLPLQIVVMPDTDGDGVPDAVEQGPDGLNLAYDGNGDGTPDWQQASVISFPSHANRGYLTAALSEGQFQRARTVPSEGGDHRSYGLDLIDFRVVGLTSGGSTRLMLTMPSYLTAKGYGKFGPEPGNTTAHWYDFGFDSSSATGAQISGNKVTLFLKDGARGDDDLTANGEIVDVGGPVDVHVAGVGAAASTSQTADASGSGGSGGGGCTIGDPSQRDMSLVLLALLAVIGTLWRVYARSANRERSK